MNSEEENSTNYDAAGHTRRSQDIVSVMPSTLKEICMIYGMSYKTMRSMLAPIRDKIGHKHGRLLTVRQVEMILNYIGIPHTLKEI